MTERRYIKNPNFSPQFSTGARPFQTFSQFESLPQHDEFKGYGRGKNEAEIGELTRFRQQAEDDMTITFLSRILHEDEEARKKRPLHFITLLSSATPKYHSVKAFKEMTEQELIDFSAGIIGENLGFLWDKKNIEADFKKNKTIAYIAKAKEKGFSLEAILAELLAEKNLYAERRAAVKGQERGRKKAQKEEI